MPTIKDVAKLAQVSSATVSRILNNDATLSVPEETRRTVLHAAETLHYIKKRREIQQNHINNKDNNGKRRNK